MHLTQLTMHGFKSFAQKTSLAFLPRSGGAFPITAIVGPNGSGKSNILEAIRWALGEQSMKQLRGKKHEDVIFSGSNHRARLGYAEVTLTFDNSDHILPVSLSEVAITRRLYRDLQSEYLVNQRPVRLMDITMMLAQAHVGNQTYNVISQGMVEHLLLATPRERKTMIDEAAGVRPYQLKRQEALNKLTTTRENITQAQTILSEIEPRLRTLTRLVKRLERRTTIEQESERVARIYYGRLWREGSGALEAVRSTIRTLQPTVEKQSREIQAIQQVLEQSQQESPASQKLVSLQREFEKRQNEREALRRAQWEREKRDSAHPAPSISTREVLTTVEAMLKNCDAALAAMPPLEVRQYRTLIEDLQHKLKTLHNSLAPAKASPVDASPSPPQASVAVEEITRKITTLQQTMTALLSAQEKERKELLTKQQELHALSRKREQQKEQLSAVRVEEARLQTRQEDLGEEIRRELRMDPASLSVGPLPASTESTSMLAETMRKLKQEREMVGSIDPEVTTEYQTTKQRHDFLQDQLIDLEQSMSKLETIIKDLDATMHKEFQRAFETIAKEFSKAFSELFGGGKATLSLIEIEKETGEESGIEKETEKVNEAQERENEWLVGGIDIQATPPGKRMKNIALLSGGEKALTAVALLCAILSFRPSPFMVLDEVDAALDEANSARFAQILKRLAHNTQFIIITHNRATMHAAQAFYGVTMGAEGISQVLSMKLEEAEEVTPGA